MSQKILVLGTDPAVGLKCDEALRLAGYEVQRFREPAAAVKAAEAGGCDVFLVADSAPELDALEILKQLKAASLPAGVVVLSRNATVEAAVAAMKEGAADYLAEPSSDEEMQAVVQRVGRLARACALPGDVETDAESAQGFEGMLGQCPAMLDVFALIELIAPADSTVLVTGESGTGKEMVVRAIHRLSRRREYPLLACDCTSLAPTLLESELFGHVKGSFSGAIATKQGLFEAAHRGTLLLDEVANLSLETQGKLLRVLETRRVRKVGDTGEHDVDIRLITTTNRSLAEMVKVGAFRADLYYRLNVVPISLPPLCDRPGDIPLLTTVFLKQFAHNMGIEAGGFCREAMQQMEVYRWPGNVRELRNIVERLGVLYGGTRVGLCHLPPEIRQARPTVSTAVTPRTWDELKRLKRQIVDELERRFVIEALERSSQNISQAANSVGMQRTNFHALLRNLGLKSDGTRPKAEPCGEEDL
jgi:DNA-binding NtrC family response regulator